MAKPDGLPLPIRPLQILIIDPDPIMRMGLRVLLEKSAIWQVLEAESAVAGLTLIRQQLAAPATARLGLVILEPSLTLVEQPGNPYLWQFLKPEFPRLPLLLFGPAPGNTYLALARRLGVEGYSAKGLAADDLVKLVAQLSNGERAWPAEIQRQLLGFAPGTVAAEPAQLNLVQRWRYGLVASGLEEMDATLAMFRTQLQRQDLSWLDQLILSGRQREVRAARWLVQRVLPVAVVPPSAPSAPSAKPAGSPTANSSAGGTQIGNPTGATPSLTPTRVPARAGALATVGRSALANEPAFAHIGAVLIETLRTKASVSLANSSPDVLEIDIFRPVQRLELIDTVLHRFNRLLEDLRESKVTPLQLVEQRSQLLRDLWRDCITEFYGRYTNLTLVQTSEADQTIALVPTLLQEETAVQSSILEPIPLVPDLLAHLLFGTALSIQNTAHAPGTVEGMRYAQILLENLVLRIANGVVQPLLNQFADQESIKQTYYDYPLLSSREVERFRNRLSWQYRIQYLFQDPQAMFESRVGLLALGEAGISRTSIYLPRQEELRQLQGWRAGVTLALEFRDAVAPPLRTAVAFLGQGIFYFLTQVVGRGLGLIGRGIAQGLGSSWQEAQTARRNSPPS